MLHDCLGDEDMDASGHVQDTCHTVQLQAEKERLKMEAEDMLQGPEVRGSANSNICIFRHVS